MKYFFGEVGVNADIERHRKAERELQTKIDALEAIEDPTESEKINIRFYRSAMCRLLVSKANVVRKLGRK